MSPLAFSEMLASAVVTESDDTPRRPWPQQGEQFDALFGVNEFGDVEWISPPESVAEVMSDYTRTGIVDDTLFGDLAIQGLLEKAGQYKVRVEFHEEPAYRSYHSCGDDYECGFNILSVEEIK